MKRSPRDIEIDRASKRQTAARDRLQKIADYTAKLKQDEHDKKIVVSQSRMDWLLHQLDLARKDVLEIGKTLERLHEM